MNKVALFTNKVDGDDTTRIIYIETNLLPRNMESVVNECEGLFSTHSLKDYYLQSTQGDSHAFRVLFDGTHMKPKCPELFSEYAKYSKRMIDSVSPLALINDCYDITFNWAYQTLEEIVEDDDTPTVVGVVNFLYAITKDDNEIPSSESILHCCVDGMNETILEVNSWDVNRPCETAGDAISRILENFTDVYAMRETKFPESGEYFESFVSFAQTGKHTKELPIPTSVS